MRKLKRISMMTVVIVGIITTIILSSINIDEKFSVHTVYAQFVFTDTQESAETEAYLSCEDNIEIVPVENMEHSIFNKLPTLDDEDTFLYLDEDIQNFIWETAIQFNVPVELIFGVCYMESRFKPDADNSGLNSDGTVDYGIMGLNSRYMNYYAEIYNDGKTIDPLNPYDNIYVGTQILADRLDDFNGDIIDAACSYNLGANGWRQMKENGYEWYYGEDVMLYIEILDKSTI